jgi:DeoR/GlpR family transcriptional regulator of sugar metabolism
MIPLKRQQLIMNHLIDAKAASIAELTELLKVSAITVRRDVQKLEFLGKLVSVSGGVAISTEIMSEPSHAIKLGMNQVEKEAIARVAESLIPVGSTVYLDAGTTTLALARMIVEKRGDRSDLLIVTNDLAITAWLLDNSSVRIYHTGGLVLRQNRSCVGDGAAKAIRGINIDIAFLSAPSWNSRWISTPDAEKIPVKKAAIASSIRRILVADSSKYGKVGAFKAVPMSSIKTVVTDEGFPLGAREAIEKHGIELVIASASAKAGARRMAVS